MEPVNFYTPPFFALNNFSAHQIEYEGHVYPTAEHVFQSVKCLNEQGRAEIMAAKSPSEAKALANNKFAEFSDPHWSDKKVSLMEDILRAKLAQHEEVQRVLASTGSRQIVEDSPTDYFWGEGADGSGKNVLGKLWMKIRNEQAGIG